MLLLVLFSTSSRYSTGISRFRSFLCSYCNSMLANSHEKIIFHMHTYIFAFDPIHIKYFISNISLVLFHLNNYLPRFFVRCIFTIKVEITLTSYLILNIMRNVAF